ncbi:hypothetical protein LCGC14_1514250, partial [marine sediment metagenome]
MKSVRLMIVVLVVNALGLLEMSGTLVRASFNKSTGQTHYNALPGVEVFKAELLNKFEKMRKIRGKGYRPRTRHKRLDGWAKYTNRLFLESSPY